MVVKMLFVVFWVVIPYSLIDGYQYFCTLKMEVIQSSETVVTTYKTAQNHNSEDHNNTN
jgi:hypothetical protein